MQDYFRYSETLDEAKKLYWELAKQLHPDKEGGSKEAFQELQNQFENFKPKSEKFKGETDEWNSKEYAHIIEQLLKIQNIVVEICGSFIWLSGDTKPVKDEIKAIETGSTYRRVWASKKKQWYFSPVSYKGNRKREYSMDEIREAYGSEIAKKSDENQTKRIAAAC